MTEVRCPNCGRSILNPKENPHRPFCSERCRMIDLSRWLDGEYVISEPAPEGVVPADED